MEINVRVQKPVKQEKIVWFHAKQDQDLQECLHCRYFYGNSCQCIAQHCTKEMVGLKEQMDKDSPCYGCPYKKTGRWLFSMYEKNFRKRWHGVERIACGTWHSSHAGAGSIKNKEA